LIKLKPMRDYYLNKTCLVTGAAGFIGSHLVDSLLELGAKVIGVDNLITGNINNLKKAKENNNFKFIKADVSQDPSKYLINHENDDFDLVFHFASPASPADFKKYPREIYLVNSVATDLLLQYLLKNNEEARFIFAGTSEAYGDPLEHPQKESYWGNVNPNGIRSCYDVSKRMGETICGVYFRNFNLDTRIIRIFNTYGPRINLNDGRVIPDFLNMALNKKPLLIQGTGKQTRSYCYIDDLIRGILLLASTDNLAGETVNLGNSGEFTILETAEIIQKKVNKSFDKDDLIFAEARKDDPIKRQPDITKARKLLNWLPEIKFDLGLDKTIEYFRGNDK
jgi:nucleoside-diphosphate-sugar epimerase